MMSYPYSRLKSTAWFQEHNQMLNMYHFPVCIYSEIVILDKLLSTDYIIGPVIKYASCTLISSWQILQDRCDFNAHFTDEDMSRVRSLVQGHILSDWGSSDLHTTG